ncbi:MAG: DPP IV N-terminal domain-containing protein [Anaerolineales bacterium]
MSTTTRNQSFSLLFLIMFMAVSFAGCGPPSDSLLATAQVLAVTKLASTHIAGIPTPTATPLATMTPIPTDTPPPTPTALPTSLAGGGRILFASDQDGNYEIYIMNADGGNPVRLTQNYVSDRQPAMSSNGEKIAFVSTFGGAGLGIVVMESDGSNPVHRMTFAKGVGGSPSWGPDGRLLFWAHTCLVWCNHAKYNPKFFSVMNFMDADGGNLEMVEPPFREGAPLDTHWSPDGESIAIVDGIVNIAIVNPHGGRLGANPDWYVNCRYPAWSPDGSNIAFVSNSEGNDDVYVFDIQRDRVSRLTNNPGADRSPSWSPDGKWLAFASNRDGNWNIYTVRSDGREVQRLTETTTNEVDPSWLH